MNAYHDPELDDVLQDEELPVQQRMALVLKFQEDMKIEDIAVAMGKTAGAVKLLIHRGVTRLRDESGALRPVD